MWKGKPEMSWYTYENHISEKESVFTAEILQSIAKKLSGEEVKINIDL